MSKFIFANRTVSWIRRGDYRTVIHCFLWPYVFGQIAQPQPEAPPHFLKPFWNTAAWVHRNGSQQSQENNTLLSRSHTTDWCEEQQLQCVHGEASGNRPERRGSHETNKTVIWQCQVVHRSPIGISKNSDPSDWEPGGKLGQLWQTPMSDLSRMPRNQLSCIWNCFACV